MNFNAKGSSAASPATAGWIGVAGGHQGGGVEEENARPSLSERTGREQREERSELRPFSEGHSQSKLHDARIPGSDDPAEVAVDLVSLRVELHRGIHRRELRRVEHVVRLQPELQVRTIARLDVLEER